MIVAESDIQVPFVIKRTFCITNVASGGMRGNHASKTSEFFYICIQGSIEIDVDDGFYRRTFSLKDNTEGLYLPIRTWMEVKNFSTDAILLTLASKPYNKDDYYTDYKCFIKEKHK